MALTGTAGGVGGPQIPRVVAGTLPRPGHARSLSVVGGLQPQPVALPPSAPTGRGGGPHLAAGLPPSRPVALMPLEALPSQEKCIDLYGTKATWLGKKALDPQLASALTEYRDICRNSGSRPKEAIFLLLKLIDIASLQGPQFEPFRRSLAVELRLLQGLAGKNLGGLTVLEARDVMVQGFTLEQGVQLKQGGVDFGVATHLAKAGESWESILALGKSVTLADLAAFKSLGGRELSRWAGFSTLEATAYRKAGYQPEAIQDFKGTGAPVGWVKAYRTAGYPFNAFTRPQGAVVGPLRAFGKGGLNTVYAATVQRAGGAREEILKPEQAAAQMCASQHHLVGGDVATSELARLEGLDDLVVRTSFVVTDDDRLVIAMERAGGTSLNVDLDIDVDANPEINRRVKLLESLPQDDIPGAMEIWGFKDLIRDESGKIVKVRMSVPLEGVDLSRPEVLAKLAATQNFDAVVGQIDRHLGNLFLQGTDLKLIDNTGNLGEHRSPWAICPWGRRPGGAPQALPFTRVIDRQQLERALAVNSEEQKQIALGVGKTPAEAEALASRNELRKKHFLALQRNTDVMNALERVQGLLVEARAGGPDAGEKMALARQVWAAAKKTVETAEPYVPPDSRIPLDRADCCLQMKAALDAVSRDLDAVLGDTAGDATPDPALLERAGPKLAGLLAALDQIGRVIEPTEWAQTMRYMDANTLLGRQLAGLAAQRSEGKPIAILGPDGKPMLARPAVAAAE